MKNDFHTAESLISKGLSRNVRYIKTGLAN